MKKIFFIMASIFAVLTIIFYIASLNHLDKETSRLLGVSTTINIQATVFCAAFAVMSVVCLVGGLVAKYLEENTPSSYASSASSIGGIQTEDGGIKLTSTNYWVCPKCKNRNPYSKIECRECGEIRP